MNTVSVDVVHKIDSEIGTDGGMHIGDNLVITNARRVEKEECNSNITSKPKGSNGLDQVYKSGGGDGPMVIEAQLNVLTPTNELITKQNSRELTIEAHSGSKTSVYMSVGKEIASQVK